MIPDAEGCRNFWGEIYEKDVKLNAEAEWSQDLKNELGDLEKEGEVKISAPMIKTELKNMPHWKSPGPDGMHAGYWLKKFTALDERIPTQLNECLFLRSVPEWLTKGRTVLVVKDKGKRGDVANIRPITCLPLMWKLFTRLLADTTYEHLERKSLLPGEQRGRRRNSRGTKDQLLKDKLIFKNCRRRQTGLGMVWEDYKKAYDIIPYSWIIECMNMFGVAENMTGVIQTSMKQWKTELTAGNHYWVKCVLREESFRGIAFLHYCLY